MNDFYMFSFMIGSGLYDVPLDGPKQRFLANPTQKIDLALALNKFRDRPTPSLSDDIYV